MEAFGYTYDPIEVITDDGYKLIVFRVTGNSEGPLNPDKPPVITMHGQRMDAANWLKS